VKVLRMFLRASQILKIFDGYLWDLVPSIQPGKGSAKVLSIMVGRRMTTGRFPLQFSISISPIALVNAYVFGHPNILALLRCPS
jgi:hypothetical protein